MKKTIAMLIALCLMTIILPAIAEEEISISFSFDKETVSAGDSLTGSWTITGAKGPYQSLWVTMKGKTADGGLINLAETYNASANSLTCSSVRGSQVYLSMYLTDGDGVFKSALSQNVNVTGGETDKLTITFSFDKTTVTEGDSLTGSWTITGAKEPYQSLWVTMKGKTADGGLINLAETYNASANSLTCSSVRGSQVYLSMYLTDGDGVFKSALSQNVNVTGKETDKLTITFSFDKTTVTEGDSLTGSWTITGAKEPYQSLWVTMKGKTADGGLINLAETYNASAASLTCSSVRGSQVYLSMYLTDGDGVFKSALSQNVSVTAADETPSAHQHEPITLEGREPTCTEPGLTEGSKCKTCDEVLSEQVEIPALGHDFVTFAAKAPTCVDDGNIEYEKCSRCGLIMADGEEREEADVLLPANGVHTWKKTDAVQPTCTKAGYAEGRECKVCGKAERSELAADPEGWHAYLAGQIVDAEGRLNEEKAAELAASGLIRDNKAEATGGSRSILCAECGYPLYAEQAPAFLMGDVDMNGVVDNIDALLVLRYFVEIETSLPNLAAADFNGDGTIDNIDALEILRYFVFN